MFHPRRGRAGQLPHQLTTPVRIPESASISQKVFTLRKYPETGWRCPKPAWRRTECMANSRGVIWIHELKPRQRRTSGTLIPCWIEDTPVAIVVHVTGGTVDSDGRN